MGENQHLHLVVTCFVDNPPTSAVEGEEWLRDLVDIVDMQILFDAKAIYCEDLGNEGVTGVVGLSTSHSAFHAWHLVDEPFFQMDLYSCRNFDINSVLEHVNQWSVVSGQYILMDRTPGNIKVIKQGDI